ncbi:MAG: hypothetical protein GYA50_04660 [Eubacteriaceae bacterium]|nr:hypothetical protein [Eubacteriaceae bacterium]
MKKEGNIYSYTAFERFNNSYSSAQIERWYVNTFSFYKYLLYRFGKTKDTQLSQDINFTYNHKFSVSHEIKKSSDGKYFAVMENKAVTVWDCVTGEKIASFEELKMPDTMNFSNSGKLLAVKSESGKIAIYDMTEMKFIKSWLPSKSIGCEVLFTPDDKYVVSADWKGNIYTIDIDSGEVAFIKDDLFGKYDSLKFDNETNGFIFEEEERRLIWKYPFKENEPEEQKHNYRFEETAYSEVNKCYAIMTVCMDKKMLIVDKEYKQILKEIAVPNAKGGKARTLNAAWSPDGKFFALIINTGECYRGSRIYTTQLMEYPSLRVIKEYKIPYAYFVEFTDDGKQLLIGGFETGYCIDLDTIK